MRLVAWIDMNDLEDLSPEGQIEFIQSEIIRSLNNVATVNSVVVEQDASLVEYKPCSKEPYCARPAGHEGECDDIPF